MANLFIDRGSSKLEEACDVYARAANMFKMAKNWSGKDNTYIAFTVEFALFSGIETHCQTCETLLVVCLYLRHNFLMFGVFQLQGMPSPRQLCSICRCKVNMTQPPTSLMQGMLSKKQIHKVFSSSWIFALRMLLNVTTRHLTNWVWCSFVFSFLSSEAINCLNRAIEIYTDMVRKGNMTVMTNSCH